MPKLLDWREETLRISKCITAQINTNHLMDSTLMLAAPISGRISPRAGVSTDYKLEEGLSEAL